MTCPVEDAQEAVVPIACIVCRLERGTTQWEICRPRRAGHVDVTGEIDRKIRILFPVAAAQVRGPNQAVSSLIDFGNVHITVWIACCFFRSRCRRQIERRRAKSNIGITEKVYLNVRDGDEASVPLKEE